MTQSSNFDILDFRPVFHEREVPVTFRTMGPLSYMTLPHTNFTSRRVAEHITQLSLA